MIANPTRSGRSERTVVKRLVHLMFCLWGLYWRRTQMSSRSNSFSVIHGEAKHLLSKPSPRGTAIYGSRLSHRRSEELETLEFAHQERPETVDKTLIYFYVCSEYLLALSIVTLFFLSRTNFIFIFKSIYASHRYQGHFASLHIIQYILTHVLCNLQHWRESDKWSPSYVLT